MNYPDLDPSVKAAPKKLGGGWTVEEF